MLGDGGVERKCAADRNVGERGEDETTEDGGISFATATQPINRRRDQDDAEQRLEFAPGRAADAGVARAEGLRFHVAVHVEIGGEQNQAGVFGEGARDDDWPNE